jgi:hypothetical protein
LKSEVNRVISPNAVAPNLAPVIELLKSWEGFESFENPGKAYREVEREYKERASEKMKQLFPEDALRTEVAAKDIDSLQRRYQTFIRESGYTNMIGWRDLDFVLKPLLKEKDLVLADGLLRFFGAIRVLKNG